MFSPQFHRIKKKIFSKRGDIRAFRSWDLYEFTTRKRKAIPVRGDQHSHQGAKTDNMVEFTFSV